MVVRAEFEYKGKHYDFSRPLSEFDRNYDDEDYAYFLEEIPGMEWALFEINILKDSESQSLKNDGYISVYLNADNASFDDIVNASISILY
ncbi:MAG: hypothetical protein IKS94_00190 [Prevotella sp.]|nr:hypothetical protein [Prevotella sp.]